MRGLYKLILRAHPKAFRERFGAEMLCIFDDDVRREGAFRLMIDGIISLLRQRVFRLHRAAHTAQKPAEGPQLFASFLFPPPPTPLKLSRLIFGGAVSFALFVIACSLIGGRRVPPSQRRSMYGVETKPAQALTSSDLMSVSDECAAGVHVGCVSQSPDFVRTSYKAGSGVQSKADELPYPSGRFGIGEVSYHFAPSETPSTAATSAELKLFVWYPAAIDPDTSVPVQNVWGFSKSMGKFVQTHTVENAVIAGSSRRFPLILFSPGAGSEGAAYLSQIENLVSHGYIVASLQDAEGLDAISLQDTRLTVFEADMRRAFFVPKTKEPEAVLARAEALEQSRETAECARVRFAFNQVILIATDTSRRAPVAGRIDLEHVGAFGHASGGNAVAQLCASDLRIAACLDEDGWTPNGLLPQLNPPQLPRQPFLLIDVPLKWPDGAELSYAHITRDQFTRLARNSDAAADSELKLLRSGAYRISLLRPDWNDQDFTDGPLVWSMRRGHIGNTEARTALAITNVYSRMFFDKYLKGRSAPLLDSNTDVPFSNVRVRRYVPIRTVAQ